MSQIKNIVEALLLSSGEPLSADRIHKIINSKESCTKAEILEAIDSLKIDYENKEIERALMETLSIIAYKQPVTRGDIESIRGVSVSSSIMRTLTDRNWIKIVGYRDVPGKPAMFSTTNEFLDYFGLEKLSELPDLPDIKEPQNLSLDLEAETTNEMTQISTEQLN